MNYRFGISRDGAKDFPLLVVQSKQRFPNKATARLIWGKGIESASGVATSQDQVLSYRVREQFHATFSCERENEKADCIPFLPLSAGFSAPIAREYASTIVLKGPGNAVYKPVLDNSSEDEEGGSNKQEFVHGVRFAGPFPALASFTIVLPKDIKDDDGRPLANINKFPLAVKTADYPPLAKFAAPFGIIEKEDPLLPVTLRNIEAGVKAKLFDVKNAQILLLISSRAGSPPLFG